MGCAICSSGNLLGVKNSHPKRTNQPCIYHPCTWLEKSKRTNHPNQR